MSREDSDKEISYELDENDDPSEESFKSEPSDDEDTNESKLVKLFYQNSLGVEPTKKVLNTSPNKHQKIPNKTVKESNCLRCGSNPQFIARNSGKTEISVFGSSIRLDQKILEKLGSLLSNTTLKKESESEYFAEMHIFDQEWEFPFNKKHYEFKQLMEDEENSSVEIQLEMYKRTMIDLQMKIRDLSDYFLKVDRERIYFRKKLISVLKTKVKEITELSPELKEMVSTMNNVDTKSQKKEIEKLRKENKESQSLFVNLKRRNIVLEEETKQLKKKLKEKRTQLKKYMFRKETHNEDHNITQATNNSNNLGYSGEGSYISTQGMNKFNVNHRSNKPMSKKLKFSSTILTNRQKQEAGLNQMRYKNSSQMGADKYRISNNTGQTNHGDEYFSSQSSSNYGIEMRNKFSKNSGNLQINRNNHERPSINTQEGEIEIPEMLLHLQSGRNSKNSETIGKKNSGFKFMNDLVKGNRQSNHGNKLQNIQKKNSRIFNDKDRKNPFIVRKVSNHINNF